MHRQFSALALLICFLIGCGGSGPDLPDSLRGSFGSVEGGVGDIHTNVNGKYSGELGNDQLGFAMTAFQKAAKGTKLEADADKIVAKYTELGELAAKRPSLDKLKKAVQELKDMVDETKKKM